MAENQPAIIQLHRRGKPAHAEANGNVKLIARAKIERRAPVAGLAVADVTLRHEAGAGRNQALYIHFRVDGFFRPSDGLCYVCADSLTVAALVDAGAQNAEFL
jgi:hypothetical protein